MDAATLGAAIALFQALGLTLQDGKICVKVEKE